MKSHLGHTALRYGIVLSACVFLNSSVIAAASPQPYVIQSATCNGFPRVAVDMVPGYCMGLVTSPPVEGFHQRTLRTPRMLLQLADDK